MDAQANRLLCSLILVLLPAMVGVTFAESFMPLHVGQIWEFIRYDANDPTGWSVTIEVGSQAVFDSLDYFQVQSWNYENDGQVEDFGYFRPTEQALYGYNPAGADVVVFQKGPVGAKWSVYEGGGGYGYTVREVVAVESVTVAYGTFDQAYKHRMYQCHDPNDLGLGQSAYWYEWVVPGMGIVKEEDHWTDYPPAIEELVGMRIAPVYRFWSDTLGHHFYTINEAEKAHVIANYPPPIWTFEGIAFYGCPAGSPPAGTGPVYRFWSDTLSGHFYTMSEAERDHLIANYPPPIWTYEGTAFYAYPEGSQPIGTAAVYRFWSDTLSGHFYTMSEAERDYLIANYPPPIWTYEGVAWYAYE